MAYEKQNFLDGQIVTAEHLNHMENGIVAAGNVRNLLDNSDFRNPVNQRGQTSYETPWNMTIDRWYLSSYDDSNATLTLTNDGIVVKPGTSGKVAIAQRILSKELRTDKTYTAFLKTSDGTYISGNVENHVDSLGFYQIVFIAFSETTIEWAALYDGSYTVETLPPYVPKGYAAELAECKRYYQYIPYDMDDYYVNNNTSYPSMYPVLFPEMRIIPTVTVKENWNTGAAASATVGFRTNRSLSFQVAATSSRVAWHGWLELNADL